MVVDEEVKLPTDPSFNLDKSGKALLKENFNKELFRELIKGEVNQLPPTVEDKSRISSIGQPLQVQFEPNPMTFSLAQYDAVTHTIIVNPVLIRLSRKGEQPDAIIESTLRHEKAHAQFACLDEQQQRAVVEMFMGYRAVLDDIYQQFRNQGYTYEYFSPEHGSEHIRVSGEIGRGTKVQKLIRIIDEGSRLDVDLTLVVDEFLGWANGLTKDVLSDANVSREDRLNQTIFGFLKSLSPKDLQLLSKNGLLDVQADDLLFTLKQNQHYREWCERNK